jgi:hypothetical protein
MNTQPMKNPSSENLVMSSFGPYLVALHLQDLLDEAALERRARLAHKGERGVPAWRRGLGGVFAVAARSLDPGIEARLTETRATKGSGARATA